MPRLPAPHATSVPAKLPYTGTAKSGKTAGVPELKIPQPVARSLLRLAVRQSSRLALCAAELPWQGPNKPSPADLGRPIRQYVSSHSQAKVSRVQGCATTARPFTYDLSSSHPATVTVCWASAD